MLTENKLTEEASLLKIGQRLIEFVTTSNEISV